MPSAAARSTAASSASGRPAPTAAAEPGPRRPGAGPRRSPRIRDPPPAARHLRPRRTALPAPRKPQPASPPGARRPGPPPSVNTGMASRPSGAFSVTSAMSACLSACSPCAPSASSASWATIGTKTRAVASEATTRGFVAVARQQEPRRRRDSRRPPCRRRPRSCGCWRPHRRGCARPRAGRPNRWRRRHRQGQPRCDRAAGAPEAGPLPVRRRPGVRPCSAMSGAA